VHGGATAVRDLVNPVTIAEVRRSHSKPEALVTLLRMPKMSRPQRTKSAASKTGSNSVIM
jgi:hypothetical protein